MAKDGLIQTFCILYLIVSGPIIADGRRIAAAQQAAAAEALEAGNHSDSTPKAAYEHPWCNYFSSTSTRRYHFDVELSDQHCDDGACTAIELVRDTETPLLKIHTSKAWLVKPDGKKELDWSLYSPGPERSDERVIELLDTEVIRLYDEFYHKKSKTTYPDKLEIVLAPVGSKAQLSGRPTGTLSTLSQREIFELEGGLYYDETLLVKGFDKITHEDFRAIQDEAAKPGWVATGRSKGKWIGGVGGALSVGGMYTAATVTGVAVQTQALVGAACVGIIGGTAAGFLAGGLIGAGIGLGAVLLGSTQKSGVPVLSASRKIFEKLRCMSNEFKTCSTNVLVPVSRDCPRT